MKRTLALTLLDQALISASSMLVGIFLVRSIGPSEYGTYVVLWIFVQFGQSLVVALVIAPLTTLYPRVKADERQAWISGSFYLSASVPLISCTLLLVADGGFRSLMPTWWSPEYKWPLCLWAITLQMLDSGRRHLYLKEKRHLALLTSLVSYPLFTTLVLLLPARSSLKTIINLACMSYAIGGLAAVAFLKPSKPTTELLNKIKNANWKTAKWLGGAAILQWISANSLLVLAGTLYGMTIPGTIRAAQNVVGILGTFYQALDSYLSIEAAKILESRGVQALNGYLRRSTCWLLISTGLALALIIIWPKVPLLYLYGSDPDSLVSAIRWLSVFYFTCALATPVFVYLKVSENTKPVFLGYLVNAAFALILAPKVMAASVQSVVLLLIIGEVLFLAPQYATWLRTLFPARGRR